MRAMSAATDGGAKEDEFLASSSTDIWRAEPTLEREPQPRVLSRMDGMEIIVVRDLFR